MKKVDIIYGNYLSNKIGPSTNLKRIILNQDLFRQNSIDLSVYTLDSSVGNLIDKKGLKRKIGFFSLLKIKIKSLAKKIGVEKFSWYFMVLIYMEYIRHSKKVVKKYLKNQAGEVVVFDEFFTCLEYLKSKKIKESKVILFHHGSGDVFKMLELYYPGLKGSKYLEKLNQDFKFVLSQIDKLVFVSNYGKENFLNLHPQYNKYSNIFEVLYCGVEDLENHHEKSITTTEKDDRVRLCCIGSVNERKGQSLIVEAYNELDKCEQDRIVVHFLGGGDYEYKRLDYLVKDRNQSENLIFHGPVVNVNTFLKNSDCFILTSYDEGLPISIIEALKFSLPLIITNVAGMPETFENNGYLINPNVSEVKSALKSVLFSNLEELGKNSRDMYEKKFTTDIYVKNYSQLLLEL